MEEIYKKINNGEINVNYLSPIDLVNLEMYLENINLSLNDLLKGAKETNIELSQKKINLEQEISIYATESNINQWKLN